MIDEFLKAGARGINVSHVRHETGDEETPLQSTGLTLEYSVLRCVMGEEDAIDVAARVAQSAAAAGLQDVCLFRQPVMQVATYTPGANEFRQRGRAAENPRST